jgi:hypothetical protein
MRSRTLRLLLLHRACSRKPAKADANRIGQILPARAESTNAFDDCIILDGSSEAVHDLFTRSWQTDINSGQFRAGEDGGYRARVIRSCCAPSRRAREFECAGDFTPHSTALVVATSSVIQPGARQAAEHVHRTAPVFPECCWLQVACPPPQLMLPSTELLCACPRPITKPMNATLRTK